MRPDTEPKPPAQQLLAHVGCAMLCSVKGFPGAAFLMHLLAGFVLHVGPCEEHPSRSLHLAACGIPQGTIMWFLGVPWIRV